MCILHVDCYDTRLKELEENWAGVEGWRNVIEIRQTGYCWMLFEPQPWYLDPLVESDWNWSNKKQTAIVEMAYFDLSGNHVQFGAF